MVTEIMKWLQENNVTLDKGIMPGYIDSNMMELIKFPLRDFKPRFYRMEVVKKFSFAIIDDATINFIKAIIQGKRILEVGAGLGYWAYELIRNEVDIIATDPANDLKLWFPVDPIDGPMAINKYWTNPNEIVLMSVWPSLDLNWLTVTLKHPDIVTGSTLILVSEGLGGCIGDDTLFEELESNWEEIDSYSIPNWSGIRDYLQVYVKK